MVNEKSSVVHNSENPFMEGQVYHRQRDLHDRYGGNRQSGIAPCANFYFVFLFSSPIGADYGYKDGRESENVYTHTGAGQYGDMRMNPINQAVRDHNKDQRELHLFKKVSPGYYKYVGQFEYDSHDIVQGIDVEGKTRKIIQFKLRKL